MSGDDVDTEGVWNSVRKKHFKAWIPRWDVFSVGKMKEVKRLESIYVSHFPDRCKARDLFQVFGCIGEIFEVAISPRRNKVGKRFGFARFVDVADARLLAMKVDNVSFDGVKIHANVPRFSRKAAEGYPHRVLKKDGALPSFKGGRFYEGQGANSVIDASRRKPRSFVDVVADRFEGGDNLVIKKSPLIYSSMEEDRVRLSKALVGTLRIPGSGMGIQLQVERAGFFAIKVIPLGATKCLLEEIEEGSLVDFTKEGETWWQDWFSEVSEWKIDLVDPFRTVWLHF
ncbi:uncharacterized protein LOC131640589 [Vicia villosa]|uniref:uncharacterized protein LOC131640589 n=1 Tax=Vicia villosa TaxID=3911 RepID=UPI00273AFE94|nr:uncharacterized protein LOC131640589 [Vicia villosa]